MQNQSTQTSSISGPVGSEHAFRMFQAAFASISSGDQVDLGPDYVMESNQHGGFMMLLNKPWSHEMDIHQFLCSGTFLAPLGGSGGSVWRVLPAGLDRFDSFSTIFPRETTTPSSRGSRKKRMKGPAGDEHLRIQLRFV